MNLETITRIRNGLVVLSIAIFIVMHGFAFSAVMFTIFKVLLGICLIAIGTMIGLRIILSKESRV